MSSYALGIDLGGSSIKAAAVTAKGEVLARRTVEFALDQEMDWAPQIRELAKQIQSELGSPADGIGLSAPGLVAHHGRAIAHMPGRLAGLEGLDWTAFFHSAKPVPVLNDAHAALLGEAWIGAAPGLDNVFMLTLGTGVGGAALVNGRLLRGHLGRAGHLGHICLEPEGPLDIVHTPGSLEFMIGNYSIRERSRGRFESTHALIAAHQKGDLDATRVWLRSVKALACAITSLINVLDPETTIIGGGIARAGEALFGPLVEYLEPIEWRPSGNPVKIVAAKLGEYAGAVGMAHEALGRARPA
jgi:glucokinase